LNKPRNGPFCSIKRNERVIVGVNFVISGWVGAGAIFRQNKLLHGVTTAATLWFVGLCIGGG